MEGPHYVMSHLDSENYEQAENSVYLPANSAYDLDIRRRAALAEVDNARISWTHARVCIVAGVGFFTDAYDLFAINIAATMLGYVYGRDQCMNECLKGCTSGVDIPSCKLTANQDLGLKVAAQVGTLIGQLLFGWLADVLGRKKMYGIELLIIIVATFGQAVSASSLKVDVFGILIAWRFFMGLGIGGDYPLSAVISSEFAATKFRGRMMAGVFAFQGFGNFSASIVAVTITTLCKNGLQNAHDAQATIDFMWRLFIGLGVVPAVIALYFRLTIPETPRFTMDVKRNLDKAAAIIRAEFSMKETPVDKNILGRRINIPQASWRDFTAYFRKPKNFQILFGTSYSWFALDIAFYGLGLNATSTLQDVGLFGKPGTDIYESLHQICKINLILSAVLIPGYWATFSLIDIWGRKPIQLMGFTILTVLFLVFGFGYHKLTPKITNVTPVCSNVTVPPTNMTCSTMSMSSTFRNTQSGFIGSGGAVILLYCLAGFFENFGPNVTSFVVPGEIFPTRYRSTAHGISAASGKLGSIIAQIIVSRNRSPQVPFEVFAFFMMSGIGSTLLLPETMGRSLEELSNEDQIGFVRGQ